MEHNDDDALRLSNLVAQDTTPSDASVSLQVTTATLEFHARQAEQHVDALAEAHRQHIDAIHFDILTEVHRLRGEVLALREEMHDSQSKVIEAMRGLRVPIRRVAGKVDDIWRSNRGVSRLVRRGEAKGAATGPGPTER